MSRRFLTQLEGLVSRPGNSVYKRAIPIALGALVLTVVYLIRRGRVDG